MLGNKLGHAYLVPRRDKKANNILKCQMLIGYRGFIALAHRTGKVSSIFGAIVHQGDEFTLKLGTGRQLCHVPLVEPSKRGDWIGAYAVLEFRDARTDFEWMTRPEIEKVKECSESAGEAWSPWRRFEDEMIKKSPIRRMAKRLCMSSEDVTLVEAAVRDEYREMGIEDDQRALAPASEPPLGLPPANARRMPMTKPQIREPQRRAQPQNGTAAPPPPLNGGPQPGTQASSATDPKDNTTTVQGVVGPLEPDASGNTVRRTGKGAEYVVFTMGRNGSTTRVYSNQLAVTPEIAARQGREARARVSVVHENGRQYYVLCNFAEG
jgi:recombinational DNA repair protein RecT